MNIDDEQGSEAVEELTIEQQLELVRKKRESRFSDPLTFEPTIIKKSDGSDPLV